MSESGASKADHAVEKTSSGSGETASLQPETLTAFSEHIAAAEADLVASLPPGAPFLWSDTAPERAELVRKGKTVAALWAGDHPISVPKGLIHDWVGAILIPGANIENTLALVQNYDRHKEIYRPEVVDSRLISREGNVFEIYLRLLKKKIITVVLDTEHHVEYAPVSAARWWCRSYTTRITEIEDAGKPGEWARLPDNGYGFLWRLVSYWRFEQRDEGVWVECRAISLTRDVPKGLGWAIHPMVKKLPRESLIRTLEATRRAYRAA